MKLEFIDIDYADCNTDKLQEMAKKLETIFTIMMI